MQGKNFTLPTKERVPSLFWAYALFFCAAAGRLLVPYLGSALSFIISYFLEGTTGAFTQNITQITYYVVFILLPISACVRLNPGITEYMRVKPLPGITSVMCVIAGIAGSLCVTYLNYLWLIPIEEMGGVLRGSSIIIPQTAGGMMMTIFVSAALPGICEELLFRGAILSAQECRGSKKALVITALMFMSLHGSVSGMPAELLSGLVLGFIVISTDSIFAGIIYHTIHNASLLIISYAASSTAGTAEAESMRLYELIGGVPGLIQVTVMGLLFGGIVVYILLRIERRNRDRNFGFEPANLPERSWQELIAMGCCVMTVLLFYTEDILSLLGVLK